MRGTADGRRDAGFSPEPSRRKVVALEPVRADWNAKLASGWKPRRALRIGGAGGAGADAPPRDSAELRGLTAEIRGAFFNSGFDWGEEHPYLPADFFAGCGVFAHIKKWAGFDWDAAKEAKKSCAFPHQARRVLLPRAGFHFPNPLSVSLFIPGPFKNIRHSGMCGGGKLPELAYCARRAESVIFIP